MSHPRVTLLAPFHLIVAASAAVAGCVDGPDTSAVASPGMLNGMLNGFFHTEGLEAFLWEECPLLAERLFVTGNLEATSSPALGAELAKPVCERFMFYTVQLMAPFGETVTLSTAAGPTATFTGKMGLQHLVQQAYPQYELATHAFLPWYPVARKVVTQAYAAFTNGIARAVSFKTNVPALDAHRDPVEDTWPRELLQLVPFTPQGIAAMASDPAFLARLPDFFRPCDPQLTNYDYLSAPPVPAPCSDTSAVACKDAPLPAHLGPPSPLAPPPGYCPVPVVVHGNVDFVEDVVPGRSCRILQPGEDVPYGAFVSGDVIVPEGGCPLIYYAGRTQGETIYDDRALNPGGTDDGCDAAGPSALVNCDFDVIAGEGVPVPDAYIDYYIFNVAPVSQ